MPLQVNVIDIFAGPGGLGEGFTNFSPDAKHHPFRIRVSAEMESSAHRTLTLRSFYRKTIALDGRAPKEYYQFLEKVSHGDAQSAGDFFSSSAYASLWREATLEARQLVLGTEDGDKELAGMVSRIHNSGDALVLIGGPPCQAYSLVGRARNARNSSFHTKGDHKHYLYRSYLGLLAEYKPDIFILENVKGILSSTVAGKGMFGQIVSDLSNPTAAMGSTGKRSMESEYVLLPLLTGDMGAEDPRSFVVKAETLGVPQARHRVIIMGVRRAVFGSISQSPVLAKNEEPVHLRDVLKDLPALRSGLSSGFDTGSAWLSEVRHQRRRLMGMLGRDAMDLKHHLRHLNFDPSLERSSSVYADEYLSPRHSHYFRDPRLRHVLNHETRSHMNDDLGRYLFTSVYSAERKRSPVSGEFPPELYPDHKSWSLGQFADRFRAQSPIHPASTITSHLSKDGHAFIHWDPEQCRSLTVREAARAQTFPDNYLFLGGRTQQYVQVGNAVPPLLAQRIAEVVWSLLVNRRKH